MLIEKCRLKVIKVENILILRKWFRENRIKDEINKW